MVADRPIGQGDVWWASLREPRGSEPGYRRPVLIVQQTPINSSAIRTVLCVALTSNLALASAPGNVLLPAAKTHLPKDSVANVTQVITLDKQFLSEYIATVPDRLLNQVLDGILYVIGR
jgi:mRNA interferase MazF